MYFTIHQSIVSAYGRAEIVDAPTKWRFYIEEGEVFEGEGFWERPDGDTQSIVVLRVENRIATIETDI